MNAVEELMLQNRGNIDEGMEKIGQICEFLAATVGQLHPTLKAVFEGFAQLLKNPEGGEEQYLSAKLKEVNNELVAIQNQIACIAQQMQRTAMSNQNFDHEVKIIGQLEKFLEFVTAEPKYKDQTKDTFLIYFEITKKDLSLEALYNAVTGENFSGEAMLEKFVAIEQKSRRAVEEFCAGLMGLFTMGIIAVMGYTALKEGSVRIDRVRTKWLDRLEDVKRRVKAAVDDCIYNFATQAKKDIKCHLQVQRSIDETTQSLLKILTEKYYWVSWSLLVVSHNDCFFKKCLAGKNDRGHRGGGNVTVTENNIEAVVSFSTDPKPIDKSQVQEQIKALEKTRNMEDVAETLHQHLPNCVVHAVSRYKELATEHNFPKECFYSGKHGVADLYIHSE